MEIHVPLALTDLCYIYKMRILGSWKGLGWDGVGWGIYGCRGGGNIAKEILLLRPNTTNIFLWRVEVGGVYISLDMEGRKEGRKERKGY